MRSKTGKVLEALGNDSYLIKVDGTQRVTKRNRQFLRRLEIFQADTNTPSILVWTPPAPIISTQADTTEFIDPVDGDADRANAPEPDLTGPTTRSAARSAQQIPPHQPVPQEAAHAVPQVLPVGHPQHLHHDDHYLPGAGPLPLPPQLHHFQPMPHPAQPNPAGPHGPAPSSSLPCHLEYLTTAHSGGWKQTGDRFRPPDSCTRTWPP